MKFNKNLGILFDKYNFDYIYINPKQLEYLEWDFIPEEYLVDSKNEPGYLGTITLQNDHIKVYYDKKIIPGDMIFKYKDIKEERKIKLFDIINNSIN
jgi:hypothetical protein